MRRREYERGSWGAPRAWDGPRSTASEQLGMSWHVAGAPSAVRTGWARYCSSSPRHVSCMLYHGCWLWTEKCKSLSPRIAWESRAKRRLRSVNSNRQHSWHHPPLGRPGGMSKHKAGSARELQRAEELRSIITMLWLSVRAKPLPPRSPRGLEGRWWLSRDMWPGLFFRGRLNPRVRRTPNQDL